MLCHTKEFLCHDARTTDPHHPGATLLHAAGHPHGHRTRGGEFAAWFKALADPTRIRILNLLADSHEPVCVCDITDHFPLGPADDLASPEGPA